MGSHAGFYRTNLFGDMAYKSFVPSPLPPELQFDEDMVSLLTKANRSIATLETISNRIPNTNLFTAMYVRMEALISSQIEGTQATSERIYHCEKCGNEIDRDLQAAINLRRYANRLTQYPHVSGELKPVERHTKRW